MNVFGNYRANSRCSNTLRVPFLNVLGLRGARAQGPRPDRSAEDIVLIPASWILDFGSHVNNMGV
jgi:hypothetical protein